jgi:hypothetical protein
MIEERLRETFDRVSATGPDETGAFDRFLRRRARRARAVAATTALALVVPLAAVVAVPRLVGDEQRPRLYVTGQPGPERWQPGPLVAVAPAQGFEVDVPAGWEATATWKGLALRPVSEDLRRLLNVPVALDTTYLEAFYQPDSGDRYRDESWLPRAAEARPRQDPQARGRFPGGRGWFRTDGRDGPFHVTRWYVSWPYHCPAGQPCPDVLAMRALRVAFQVDPAAVPEVAGLAERLLRSARPITNAVAGRAHAPRPDCIEGKSMVTTRLPGDGPPEAWARTVIHFWLEFQTTSNLVPCTVRGPVGVELVDQHGRRLEVQGNPLAVSPVGDLPDNRSPTRGPGALVLNLKWYNWCGEGQAYLRWVGDSVSDGIQIPSPRCTISAKPSVLAVDRRWSG